MGADAALTPPKWSEAKLKKQSSYNRNSQIRRNISRTLNNCKVYSAHSLVRQNTVQNEKTLKSFNKENNIYNQTTNLISKHYSATFDTKPSVCRNLKLACYENISLESKLSKENENTSLDHSEIRKKMMTYSKDHISDKKPNNKYQAIFYKDICISGKNMSLWKRLRYRLRSLISIKARSDAYNDSTGLSRTFSTCKNKKSNDLRNNLKNDNNLKNSNDSPYSKNYVAMHISVKKSNTKQKLINHNNNVYDTKSVKLPVLNFPDCSINNIKKLNKGVGQTRISEVIKYTLGNLLDECNPQCEDIISCPYKVRCSENKNKCIRKSKCVTAKTDCTDKCISCIPICQDKKNSLHIPISELCDIRTNTNRLVINKNRENHFVKCKQVSKKIQGLFIKSNYPETMGKGKGCNVNASTSDKKSKSRGNKKRRAICKCVKTQCIAQAEDNMRRLNEKQCRKSCRAQYVKRNHKISKQREFCKPSKRTLNDCVGCKGLSEKKKYFDDTENTACKRVRIKSFASQQHDISRSNNTGSKKVVGSKTLNQKAKEKPVCCINMRKKKICFGENSNLIIQTLRNLSPVLSKHDKHQLIRRNSCSSCAVPSRQSKKSCRHNKTNGQFYMKNKPSKSIRSDMDITYKGSKNRQGYCRHSHCRSDRDDSNSCSSQQRSRKHRAMCSVETQVGDGTQYFKTHSRNCSSNYQIRPKRQCQSTICSDSLPRDVCVKGCSIVPLLHDKECCTTPQKQYCKSCFTSSTSSNNCTENSMQLRIRPKICTCTKNLNKTICHKAKTTCVKKKQCQRNKNRLYCSLLRIMKKLKCCYKIKQCQQLKCTRMNGFQLDSDRKFFYKYTLRQIPCPSFNLMCPVAAPYSLSWGCIWQHCSQMFGFISIACFWCPILFFFEFCKMCLCKCFYD